MKKDWSIFVEEDDIVHTFKIASWAQFRPKSSEEDEMPYYKLMKHVAELLNRPVTQVQVQEVCVSDTIDSMLKTYVRSWYCKASPYLQENTQALDKGLAMISLQYGPVVISGEFVDNHHIYIRRW